jgi:hypothetical protein
MRILFQAFLFVVLAFAAPSWADDLSCVIPGAPVTINYSGSENTHKAKVEYVSPGYCVGIHISGSIMYTTLDQAGGLSCERSMVQVDWFDLANSAFNGFGMRKFVPAECGPVQDCVDTATANVGERSYIYYDAGIEMANVKISSVNDKCYTMDYGGSPIWFPLSALQPRCNLLGAPAAFDYELRSSDPC